MVDRTLEIIQYFNPQYWWIENPNGSSMWKYIEDKHNYLNFETYIFDYCKYSDYGYKKPTRFITNYKGVEALRCKRDCEHIIVTETETKKKYEHRINLANGRSKGRGVSGTKREERYRIPILIILELLKPILNEN
jgi:hypothetical protein